MKSFKEFLNEAAIKAGDGVSISGTQDGIVHKILSTGDLAVVITGWDYFGGDLQPDRPNTSIEDVSDLKKKKVEKEFKEMYDLVKNKKL